MIITPCYENERFANAIISETVEVQWQIPPCTLLENVDVKLQSERKVFEAGHYIQMPTKWELLLAREGDSLHVFIFLLCFPAENQEVMASLQCSVACQPFRPEMEEYPKDFRSHPAWGIAYVIPSIQEVLFPTTNNCTFENGLLRIRVRVRLYNDIIIPNPELEPQMFSPQNASCLAVAHDLQKLLDSGEMADITFRMNGGPFIKAHSSILMARAPYFHSLCQNMSNEILPPELRGISYNALKNALTFIYTGKLSLGWSLHSSEILDVADILGLPHLKEFCQNKTKALTKAVVARFIFKREVLNSSNMAKHAILDYINNNMDEVMRERMKQYHIRKNAQSSLSSQ